MVVDFEHTPPTDVGLTQALYAGRLFLLHATAASMALVDAVESRLEALFVDDGGARRAAQTVPDAEFFRRIGKLRKELYTSSAFHEPVRAVLEALGLDPSRIAFDPLRLRVIHSGGHRNPLAQAVYVMHRDTWYAHPSALITGWFPLHDLPAEQTFVFYPASFDRPAPNDSETFDYGEWTREGPSLKIGWQNRWAGARAQYPAQRGPYDPGPPLGFSCTRAQTLLFSGAHLHRTLPQESGLTRFSLDVRWVDLDDAQRGVGAPNVDNRSRGSSLPDYIHPPKTSAGSTSGYAPPHNPGMDKGSLVRGRRAPGSA